MDRINKYIWTKVIFQEKTYHQLNHVTLQIIDPKIRFEYDHLRSSSLNQIHTVCTVLYIAIYVIGLTYNGRWGELFTTTNMLDTWAQISCFCLYTFFRIKLPLYTQLTFYVL